MELNNNEKIVYKISSKINNAGNYFRFENYVVTNREPNFWPS
jgi:hypothetical protein